jgi:putative ABC transport system permease protein
VYLLRLIFKNAWRHKLRTGLTVVGIVVAIVAFGLLRTVIDAWYSGANGTSSARLVTRNAISLTFFLPLNYAEKIRRVPGVASVTWSEWFGGVYQSERNFFPQFAIDPNGYLDLYPEFVLAPEQRKAFLLDRKGCIAGRKLAEQYGWKIGDQIPLRGTIFSGTWNFTLRGIYTGAEASTDERLFFLRWDYLNESIKRLAPRRGDFVGVYIIGLRDPDRAAEVSEAIDRTFKNSLAETLTETEKAFQLGFVAMSEQILLAIQAVSFVIILIIMAVMANTMAMTARERVPEYATLKALGFGDGYIVALIGGESLAIALIGGVLGIALTFPIADGFARAVGPIFPAFHISHTTIVTQFAAAVLVGTVAAILPAWRSARIRIVDGLRAIA